MISEYHRMAISKNVGEAELVAVGYHNEARFGEMEAHFGVPCSGVEEVLADISIDAVCVCTPTGQHAAQTISAASAGKHVLVEKPMAVSLAEADAMIAACDRAGVRLGVVLQRRMEPVFRSVRTAIEAGALGDLTVGSVTIPYYRPQSYYETADWRGTWALDGGGVLMNQGIHLVDLIVWYMGEPTHVQAHASTLHRDIEVEDTLTALLRFANGAMATITATTTVEPGFPHRVEVYGTDGGVQLEGESVLRWQTKGPGTSNLGPLSVGSAEDIGASADPRAISLSGHVAIVRDFVSSVHNNVPSQVDGNAGRKSLKTVLSIYEAARGEY